LDLPHEIYAQVNDVRKVLSLWADDISHHEFLAQIKWRLSLDSDSMPSPLPMQQLYFPLDLIALSSDEVFVDCGAFDGASITSFIQHSGANFQKLIALEPDPSNFQKLQKYILSLPANLRDRVVAFQIAAGQQKGIAHFESTGTVVSRVNKSGEIEVVSASFDDILQGYSPTYIKMDIEGSELDALAGARAIIKRADTVWAICAYHKQDDLWKIPLFIKSISDDYCFYLRRYAEECWELVCYAIPAKRMIK
jgi:FkbM family methyltransferase